MSPIHTPTPEPPRDPSPPPKQVAKPKKRKGIAHICSWVCQFVKEVVRTVVNKLKKVMQVFEVENTRTTEKFASWFDKMTCLIIEPLDSIEGTS